MLKFLESLENRFRMSSLKVIYQEWNDGQRRSTPEGTGGGVNSNQNLSDGSSSIPLCVHVDILCVSGMNEEGINQW